jgi:hypothetical protein
MITDKKILMNSTSGFIGYHVKGHFPDNHDIFIRYPVLRGLKSIIHDTANRPVITSFDLKPEDKPQAEFEETIEP